jgi:hypothetical protein
MGLTSYLHEELVVRGKRWESKVSVIYSALS